jgi:hypothetical protein
MLRWLPWRFLVKHAARRYGVLDPATFLARMRRFAQPSEVQEPIELLRAGIVFHARGLVNSKAIQHNLDWVWPYWVERQFNPEDPSFIPRAFSFSHVNLTHRNWTAVGLPDLPVFPIVDPRGLVTPLYDGWSLDFWIVTDSRKRLLPSKLEDAEVGQLWHFEPTLMVETTCAASSFPLRLRLRTWVEPVAGKAPVLRVMACAHSAEAGWLVVAVRPYNPEGVQFIDKITARHHAFVVNGTTRVEFADPPEALRMAHYAEGDVYLDLHASSGRTEMKCDVGMATAAALFRLEGSVRRTLDVSVPLEEALREAEVKVPEATSRSWQTAVAETAALKVPDARVQFLFDAAIRTLLLLSTKELVPGPYTYRRFWFRDACLMLHPLLAMGLVDRAERVLRTFPKRQTLGGYFLSQEGEWDSNGQVLWIAARFAAMTGRGIPAELEAVLPKAIDWLDRKRLGADAAVGVGGLLPPGFSAEHLGPNDYYYWDDYWAAGGLLAMERYWTTRGRIELAERAGSLGREFLGSIEKSLAAIPAGRAKGAVPAAPGRRLDAGAIGSMVADYPLQVYPPGEARMIATADFLTGHSFHKGGFFQEMIHSGINAYLTLDLAQTYLRAGDGRFGDLLRAVAALASPTGQWPEAIHPNTLGGCMGDGQHGWAAAEWVMLLRNCFVREEEHGERLVIGSGILPEWLDGDAEMFFGPTLTSWGKVSVRVSSGAITVEGTWRGSAPAMRIEVPGRAAIGPAEAGRTYVLEEVGP